MRQNDWDWMTGSLTEKMFPMVGTSWKDETYIDEDGTEVHRNNSEYETYNNSMKFVLTHQRWDPKDPSTREASDLFAEIALAIEEILDREIDWGDLELFSALGTSLDFYHGIDAFVRYRRRKIVTMDITRNPLKEEGKADFILQFSGLEENEKGYVFKKPAKEIARLLLAHAA